MSRAPVRVSLQRQILWFGGDRRLVGVSGLLLGIMTASLFVGYGILYGLTFILPLLAWFGILFVGREMAVADPLLVDVMLRQFKYRKYYAAKAHLTVESPAIKDYPK